MIKELLQSKSQSYIRDEDGNIMVMTAAALGVIIAIAGLAVETSQLREHSGSNQSALDAATLAGAAKHLRTGQSAHARNAVDSYWDSNKDESYRLDALGNADIEVIDGRGPGIKIRVKTETIARVDHQLGAVLAGDGEFASTIASDVIIDIPPTEITLIPDLSGSMNAGGRWANASQAIKVFGHGFLTWADYIPETVNVNLLPFGETTNFKNHYYFQQYLRDAAEPSDKINPDEQEILAGGTMIYSAPSLRSRQIPVCEKVAYRNTLKQGNPWDGTETVIEYWDRAECRQEGIIYYPDDKPDPWPSDWPKWGFTPIYEPYAAGTESDDSDTAYRYDEVSCSEPNDGKDRKILSISPGTCTIDGGVGRMPDGGTRDLPDVTYDCGVPVYGAEVCYTKTEVGRAIEDLIEFRPYGYIANSEPQWSGCFNYTTSDWGDNKNRITEMLDTPDMWLDDTLRKQFDQLIVSDDGDCTENMTKFSISDMRDFKNHVDDWNPDSHTSHDIAAAWTRNFFTGDFDEFLQDVTPGRTTYHDRQYAIFMTDGELFSFERGNNSHYEAGFADLCNTMKAEGAEIFTIAFDVTDTGLRRALSECATSVEEHYYIAEPDNIQGVLQAIAGYIKRDWIRIDG